MDSPETKIWAGGFLYNPENASVFLHLRDNKAKLNPNKYAFFGGLVFAGLEKPIDGFIRELKEEINLEINSSDVIPLLQNKSEELNTLRYVFYVKSNIESKDLILKEGAGFKWIPLKDIDKYDISKLTKDDLIYFFKFISKNS